MLEESNESALTYSLAWEVEVLLEEEQRRQIVKEQELQ